MNEERGFSLIELLVIITVIGIIAVLALLILGSTRQSNRDRIRKSVAQEIQKVNKTYREKNDDYASDVGDTNASCAGAGAMTLVGAGLMGCPSQQARSGGADVTWDSAYTYTDSSNWSITTDLERGGTFSCDQDGCR